MLYGLHTAFFSSVESLILLSLEKRLRGTASPGKDFPHDLCQYREGERSQIRLSEKAAGKQAYKGPKVLISRSSDRMRNIMESLILAQNERWRRVLSMQVERQGEQSP